MALGTWTLKFQTKCGLNKTSHNKALMPAAGDVLLSSFVFLISFGLWDKARHRNPQPS
jgi:hypothetical protein